MGRQLLLCSPCYLIRVFFLHVWTSTLPRWCSRFFQVASVVTIAVFLQIVGFKCPGALHCVTLPAFRRCISTSSVAGVLVLVLAVLVTALVCHRTRSHRYGDYGFHRVGRDEGNIFHDDIEVSQKTMHGHEYHDEPVAAHKLLAMEYHDTESSEDEMYSYRLSKM